MKLALTFLNFNKPKEKHMLSSLLHQKKIQFLFAFLLGALSVLAFPPFSYLFVLFVSIPGFLFLLDMQENKKGGFWVASFFGFSHFIFSLSWISNALKISPQFEPLIPMALIAPALFGFYVGLSGFFACFTPKGFKRTLVFAIFWGFMEWIRSFFLTGFSWNLLSSVWVEFLPMLQTLSLIGPYLLSSLTLLFFALPLFLYKKKDYKISLGLLFIFLILSLFGFERIAPNKSVLGIKLRLVQPNIAQTDKWNKSIREENFMKQIKLTRKDMPKDVTHIIWPEASMDYYMETPLFQEFVITALNQGQRLISGAVRLIDRKKLTVANSILVINDLGYIENVYDKHHLVPFGEYIPLKDFLPFQKIVQSQGEFQKGNGKKTFFLPNTPAVGFSVCYEIIFPLEVISAPRPKWILNVANDAWYGISAGPYQHLASAQMRAVEEGLPVIRDTNSGISAVISPFGEILKQLPLGSQGVLDSTLPMELHSTLYSKTKNIPLFLVAFGVLLFLFFKKRE